MTESELSRACKALLELRDVPHWRANSGAALQGQRLFRANPAGTPDILLVLPPRGRLVGLELKSKGGRLRATQREWRDRYAAAGALYWVVRDVSELDRLLTDHLAAERGAP